MGSNKTLLMLSAVLILVLIGAAAYFFIGGAEETPALTASGPATASAEEAVSREFLATLLKFQRLRVDTKIFEDPVFAGLQDKTTDLGSEPVGRDNPFAPLGEGNRSSTTTAGFFPGATR